MTMKTLMSGSPTPQSDHNYASRLESKQYTHKAVTSKTIVPTSYQGPRNSINHSHQENRLDKHSHMGVKNTAHRFPGRRV